MGIGVTVYSFFGIKIPRREFYTKKTVKAFKHEYSYSEDMQYHPKTGEKLWKTEFVPNIEDYHEYDDWSNNSNNKKLVVIYDQDMFDDDFIYILDRKSLRKSKDLMYDKLDFKIIDKNIFNYEYEKSLLVIEEFMNKQGLAFSKLNFGFHIKCNIS